MLGRQMGSDAEDGALPLRLNSVECVAQGAAHVARQVLSDAGSHRVFQSLNRTASCRVLKRELKRAAAAHVEGQLLQVTTGEVHGVDDANDSRPS